MSQLVLQGPFLTRAQAARRARVPASLLVHRPDLLRVGGRWLQEAYFAFQFDADGVRPDLGYVVHNLKGKCPDVEIADWLVRPNRSLDNSTPLRFLRSSGAVDRVMAAAERDGPIAVSPGPEGRLRPTQKPVEPDTSRRPSRPKGRRHTVSGRWALGSR